MGAGPSGCDEFVAYVPWKRKIGKAGVQMSKFPTPHAELHATKAVRVDAHTFPG